jgi:hypothetical protein
MFWIVIAIVVTITVAIVVVLYKSFDWSMTKRSSGGCHGHKD